MKSPLKYWNDFWFKKADPLPLALFRVLLGLNILEILLTHTLPNFPFFYGQNSICSLDVVATYYWFSPLIFDPFLAFHNAAAWQWTLVALILVTCLTMILGLFTRLSMVVLFFGLFGLYNENVFIYNGGDEFRRLMLLFLCFAPAGTTFSLDSVIAGLKEDWRVSGFAPKHEPVWALRWLQLQFSFIYWNVTKNKLDGPEWRDGTAVYYATHVQDLQRVYLPFLFENDIPVRFATYGTIALEGALAVLVWVKPLCYPVLLAGLLFHAGIDLVMTLPGFETAFVSAYILFIRPDDLYKFSAWLRQRIRSISGPPLSCFYNGEKKVSVQIAGVLRRLDIFRTLDITERGDMSQALICVQFKERLLTGFDAFSILCSKLPLLFVFRPLNFVLQLLAFREAIFAAVSRNFEHQIKFLSNGYHGIIFLEDNSRRQKVFVAFIVLSLVFGYGATTIERPLMVSTTKARSQGHMVENQSNKVDQRLALLSKVSKTDPRKIELYIKAAILTHLARNFHLSEEFFLLVFNNLTVKTSDYGKLYPTTLMHMADLYLDAGIPERAIYCYANVKKFDQQVWPDDQEKAARDLNNLGVARYLNGVTQTDEAIRQREFKTAENYMVRALNYKLDPVERANFLDNFALIRRERGFKDDYWFFKEESKKLTANVSGRTSAP